MVVVHEKRDVFLWSFREMLFVWKISINQESRDCCEYFFPQFVWGFFRVLWTIQKWFIASDIHIRYTKHNNADWADGFWLVVSVEVWKQESIYPDQPTEFESHKIAAIYCSFDLLFP